MMEYKCQICDRTCLNKWNLKRHVETFHTNTNPFAAILEDARRRSLELKDITVPAVHIEDEIQGIVKEEEEGEQEQEQEEEQEPEQEQEVEESQEAVEENRISNDVDVNDTATDDSDDDNDVLYRLSNNPNVEDAETSDADADDNEASGDDDNAVFNKFIFSSPMYSNLIQRRRLLRKRYADSLVWFSTLKKNRIHRKVMASAKRFAEDTKLGFNPEESLRLAVRQRKYLLDPLIEEYMETDL